MKTIPFIGFSEPLSSWTHLVAAIAFLCAGLPLLRKGRGNGVRILSLSIYIFSLIFLYSMSGVYHLLDPQGGAKDVLQRLDHSGIWVLIAGTFTPIHIILFRSYWRWVPLTVIWTLAITGLVLEVIYFKSIPEKLILSFFLGLGWFGILTGLRFKKLFRDNSLALLQWGGIFYSVGAIFDFIKWPYLWHGIFGPHEVFHIFVIAASFCHWLFIYHWAAHPIGNTIVFHIRIFPNQRILAEAKGESIIAESNSMELLKEMLKKMVEKKFHHSIQPTIHLKYFQEEHM
ncbi:MAG: hemolysin III family protein [Bdellovibrionales bacterium]|nr:hemolysin III family protein [Bdellovibrionales bacterium]